MGIHHVTDYMCAVCNKYDSEGRNCYDCRDWLCDDCQIKYEISSFEDLDPEESDPVICISCQSTLLKTCNICEEDGNAADRCRSCYSLICEKCGYDKLCFFCGMKNKKVQDYLLYITKSDSIGEILKNSLEKIKK